MRLMRWWSILIAFALPVRDEISSSSSGVRGASLVVISLVSLAFPFSLLVLSGDLGCAVPVLAIAVAVPLPFATKSTAIISASPVSIS